MEHHSQLNIMVLFHTTTETLEAFGMSWNTWSFLEQKHVEEGERMHFYHKYRYRNLCILDKLFMQ